MANFSTLIAEIEAYIKTNGEQEITGQILQNVLKDIVDTLGNGAVFKGIATTDGTPGTPDNNVFYLAVAPGTYTNYGGAVLDGSKLCALTYNGTWSTSEVLDLDNYAKIDGYYQSLTAGAAENLVGRGSVPASFLRRTTGGTADVGTGSAKVAKLMGNSIVWNQLVGSETTSVTLPSGHKYASFIMTGEGDEAALVKSLGTSDGTAIATDPSTDNVFDLTKMFGAGKEPTTVAEFTALFPLPYYAYEPGKVLPFAAGKLVTTGFNQWDEEWEVGGISSLDGTNNDNVTNRIRSKNYIPVFGGMGYYVKNGGSGTVWVFTYDADKNYIGYFSANNAVFTPSGNTAYIRICPDAAYGTTYKNDICINLSWSGYRNGEYEPYELHEAIFDPANWEDANGDKIFPYGGMHGVGTARDFATPDTDGFIRKGTRVFGRVDLGSLDWYKSNSGSVAGSFYATVDGRAYGLNMICSKYTTVAIANIMNGGITAYAVNDAAIRVYDQSYESMTTPQFKAAMSGVYLYYELATPVETELAEPVAASYYANDFGTEEWQPANGAEPYTAPCEMLIAYAMNAVDTLRRLPENYISAASFENFCTELATKLGAALNKSITIAATYDAENEEYDYAITIEDIEEG